MLFHGNQGFHDGLLCWTFFTVWECRVASFMSIACFMWADILYVHRLTAWVAEFVSACFIKLFTVRTEHLSILCWQPRAPIFPSLVELEHWVWQLQCNRCASESDFRWRNRWKYYQFKSKKITWNKQVDRQHFDPCVCLQSPTLRHITSTLNILPPTFDPRQKRTLCSSKNNIYRCFIIAIHECPRLNINSKKH